jgi:hypothetical protein
VNSFSRVSHLALCFREDISIGAGSGSTTFATSIGRRLPPALFVACTPSSVVFAAETARRFGARSGADLMNLPSGFVCFLLTFRLVAEDALDGQLNEQHVVPRENGKRPSRGYLQSSLCSLFATTQRPRVCQCPVQRRILSVSVQSGPETIPCTA